jgi:hypothetical protein
VSVCVCVRARNRACACMCVRANRQPESVSAGDLSHIVHDGTFWTDHDTWTAEAISSCTLHEEGEGYFRQGNDICEMSHG